MTYTHDIHTIHTMAYGRMTYIHDIHAWYTKQDICKTYAQDMSPTYKTVNKPTRQWTNPTRHMQSHDIHTRHTCKRYTKTHKTYKSNVVQETFSPCKRVTCRTRHTCKIYPMSCERFSVSCGYVMSYISLVEHHGSLVGFNFYRWGSCVVTAATQMKCRWYVWFGSSM